MILSMLGAASPSRAQSGVPDTTGVTPDTTAVAPATPDSVRAAPPDSLHSVTVRDSLGIPGTLKGQTTESPERMKRMLERMGSSEVEGKTQWERKKNPRVALLCNALLPGLGQTYNGRRLKVGVMVGFASYYMGNMWLNYKRWNAHEALRDAADPDSREYLFENRLADFYEEEARTYLWWSGAVWIIGLLDSWIDAHLYDVRTYTPPSPAETGIPRTSGERMSYLTIGFDLERSK